MSRFIEFTEGMVKLWENKSYEEIYNLLPTPSSIVLRQNLEKLWLNKK
jgi:hypothetical protein